jgi:threonine aldolase
VSGATRQVDLRSDTLTRPTAAMRQAMAGAEVGDDVYGEDPTVASLEERVAGMLGHEAGLFTPSGSLANQLGLRLHVKAGEEVIADSLAHVLRAEMGAAAVFSGISSRSWVAERGLLDPAQPLAMMQPAAGPAWSSSRTPTTSAAARSSRWIASPPCARRPGRRAWPCTSTAPGSGTRTSPRAPASRHTGSWPTPSRCA